MRLNFLAILTLILFLSACKLHKKQSSATTGRIILDDVQVMARHVSRVKIPQEMKPKVMDLLHTRLEISFNYQKQWVLGKATLYMRPWFDRPDSIRLDAKGFVINRVGFIGGTDTSLAGYSYTNQKLNIAIPAKAGKKDTLVLFVDYVARPAQLPNEGGRAITDSRGLYFINPLGTDPNRPRQIWTQGETEFNSCWFPTFEDPSEKHTQEINILVEKGEVSLSNGTLVKSITHPDGSHTDCWKQSKPHSTYLTMLAVGNFIVTKDKWRDIEVSYYLEPQYAPYARLIFGKTPGMIEAFSKITGVDYPWEKFSQVVCRDFVSGAMENTSAVVHYEGVQHDSREHLDNNSEDIIVHELFHHWFGDLVTSRSWGNLPLNESFATYGEYLYNEYTYGKDYADMVFSGNWYAYLRQKSKHGLSPVRLYFNEPDEMFDVVSYQKGSWILHHLRSVVGDSSFFRGMKVYLTRNAYSYADIHQLRYAMEEASGKDLTLFFNQWFLGSGHPELNVNAYFNDATGSWNIELRQVQDSAFGLFRLPLTIGYTTGGKQEMKYLSVELDSKYKLVQLPVFVNSGNNMFTYIIDPFGKLPVVLHERKTPENWLSQLKLANSYMPRARALREIGLLETDSAESVIREAVKYCLGQSEYYYRLMGIQLLIQEGLPLKEVEQEIVYEATASQHSKLRKAALQCLDSKGGWIKYQNLFYSGLNDSSYQVVATCLDIINKNKPDTALLIAARFENSNSGILQRSVAAVYAQSKADKNNYFSVHLGRFGVYRHSILTQYSLYLQSRPENELIRGIETLEKYYELNSDPNRASEMKGILNTLNKRASAQTVFEGEVYKRFYKRVENDLKD